MGALGPLHWLIILAVLAVPVVIALLVVMLASPRPKAPGPNLMPCPDCYQPVSRLAVSCPHCGRPLRDQ